MSGVIAANGGFVSTVRDVDALLFWIEFDPTT
jgi:hypothetical protein